MGGFPPLTAGLAATGGAGLGFVATGGGDLAAAGLPGREPAGLESLSALWVAFFHGAAEPFAGAIPGKTETGLALASGATDLTTSAAALFAAGVGMGRRAGGGGGAGTSFGFGGTSSR
jgi:hypothetical protein